MIGILDSGCGNLASLEHALEVLGRPSRRVAAPEALAGCDRLILPGVGHFGTAARALEARGLAAPLRAATVPLLGICLGMQLLFEGSEEAPGIRGLGLMPGTFTRFRDPALKVPHMGWSPLAFLGRTWTPYFVHGYRLEAWTGPEADLGTAVHGRPFIAAFRTGRLGGFQFHPEKSGREGLVLLEEALTWC